MGRGDTYGMQPYCCVTFVNNVVGHNTDDDDGWHAGANFAWFVGSVDRVRIVNNTFERGVGMALEHIGDGPYSGVIANNVGGGWGCLPGVTYSGNVGTACNDSDVEVSPYESTVEHGRAVRLDGGPAPHGGLAGDRCGRSGVRPEDRPRRQPARRRAGRGRLRVRVTAGHHACSVGRIMISLTATRQGRVTM